MVLEDKKKKDIMIAFIKEMVIILCAFSIAISMGYYVFHSEKQYVLYRNENKKLELKMDSLANANLLLDKKVREYGFKIDSIKLLISLKTNRINQLKKSENEKIITIDSLHSHELYNLFTGFEAR